MYILNYQEEAMLKVIIKNARIDYYRKNYHIFEEISFEEDSLYIDGEMESQIENKLDNEIQVYRLEEIFCDKKLSKIAKSLTYTEKLVIYLHYIEEQTDEQIAKVLFMTKEAISKKRLRAIKKIKNAYMKGEI